MPGQRFNPRFTVQRLCRLPRDWPVGNAVRAIGIFCAVFGTADLLWLDVGQNGATHDWPAQVAVVACCMVLACRGGVGTVAVATIAAGQLLIGFTTGTETPLSLAGVVAGYLCARHNSRRTALVAGIGAVLTSIVTVWIVGPEAVAVEAGLEVAQATFFFSAGMVVRANAAKNERLVEIEATKSAQAERLRLAREVHDVVAHTLSSISVQSGVAARLIDENPAHAKRALEHINEVGRTSLDELRAFLGLLRSDDYLLERSRKQVRPADIDSLLEEMTSSGIRIDLRAEGEFPLVAAPATVTTAYHIIQESLLNVARHAGPVETRVELVHGDEALDLRVLNEPGRKNRAAVPSTGVGIVGMTERAESVGGTLEVSVSPTGGFEVVASLPYQTLRPT